MSGRPERVRPGETQPEVVPNRGGDIRMIGLNGLIFIVIRLC